LKNFRGNKDLELQIKARPTRCNK